MNIQIELLSFLRRVAMAPGSTMVTGSTSHCCFVLSEILILLNLYA